MKMKLIHRFDPCEHKIFRPIYFNISFVELQEIFLCRAFLSQKAACFVHFFKIHFALVLVF